MNFKKLIFITVLFCTVFFSLEIFSQSGSVIYEDNASISNIFKEIMKNNPIEYKRYEEYAEYDKNINSKIEYRLQFNEDESTFKPIENVDDKGIIATKKKAFGIYYKDSVSNVHYINRRFKDYKVILTPIEWKIEQQQKEILGYNCRKATGYKICLETNDTLSWKYEAWYSEDIKIKHGPLGTEGLPGLVLQLDYSGFHLKAKSLEFEQEVRILKPERKHETIKEIKFDSIMKTKVD
jgi:GLPGLI family protein